MRRFTALVFILCVAAASVAARPLHTEDAWTIKPGSFVLETSYSFIDLEDGSRTSEYRATFQAGILRNFDIGIEIPYINIDPKGAELVNGISDALAVLKFRFMDETDESPAFTMRGEYKFPSGDEELGLGTGKSSFGLTAVMSSSFSSASFHVNAGVLYIGFPDADDVDRTDWNFGARYSFAAEMVLSTEITGVAEIIGENVFGSNDSKSVSGLVGGKYFFNKGAVIDVGITFGLSGDAPDKTIAGGFTLYF